MDTTLSKKKVLSGVFRILIPLYVTYIIFAVSVFLIFIPNQEQQVLNQKKASIQHLADSVISLLTTFESKVEQNKITPEKAREEAAIQIRQIRYGSEGKDYFWINDMHPFMIMHPYRPDLEGRDLTSFKDKNGNHPFVAMVKTVMENGSGYVNYFWQWKDLPEKIVPKVSYVKGFPSWGWIIGTGIYTRDVHQETRLISQKLIKIFAGVFVFIFLLSVYISSQVLRIEQKKTDAEKAKKLEELRLKKLLELSRMKDESTRTVLNFALKEAIKLTESRIGYIAFLSKDESQATIKTLSSGKIPPHGMEDKKLVYNIEDIGIWMELAQTGKPLVVNDFENLSAELKKGFPPQHTAVSRILTIPVIDGKKIVAFAGVGNKLIDYIESDIRQLRLMMDGLWKNIQQKKAEMSLRDSERRYKLLADNATDVIIVVKLPDLKYSYVSPAVEKLLGQPAEEMIGQKMGRNLTPDSLEKISRIISEEIKIEHSSPEAEQHRTVELEIIKEDKTAIWGEVNARFLRNRHGELVEILGIIRDISKRKEFERNLKSANTDLLMAQRLSGFGNWSANPLTGIYSWSEEIYQIFERDSGLDPLQFEEFKSVLHGRWLKDYETATDHAIKTGKPYELELKLTLSSGKNKWIHAICEPERINHSDQFLLRGTIQDITSRKTMEKQIHQTMKMEALGTLAGGIAHDFNNILSAIFGFAELSKLSAGDNQEVKNNLDQILASGLRAKELVKHILTFSRKADVQKEVLLIVTLLKESLKFLKASMPANINIETHIQHPGIKVFADPTQIHQIFINLFTNAVHAMKSTGGTLQVCLDSLYLHDKKSYPSGDLIPGQYTKLTVSDTGCGIPENIIGRIFEPFFTTKTKGEGTGMGLSQVYGIVKAMKGGISIDSSLDKGTSFYILLPEHVGKLSQKSNSSMNVLTMGKGKILFIDDEEPIVDWATQVLLKAGYTISPFTNGAKALQRFKQTPKDFNLVITDLNMKEMTGISLAQQIKTIRPDIPIILCTGFGEGLTGESIKRHGIAKILMKPTIAGELTKVANDLINRKED